MSDIGPFKFTQEVSSSAFSKMLAARVDDYFRQRGLSRHANAEMMLKTTLAFVMWIASYVWLMTGRLTPLAIIGVFLVHGFAQLFMTFNVGHDANHGAYSKTQTSQPDSRLCVRSLRRKLLHVAPDAQHIASLIRQRSRR